MIAITSIDSRVIDVIIAMVVATRHVMAIMQALIM